jgi:CRISPR-associated protein Cmr1
MQMATYTVRFITPAFLGDAEQKGAWRAPPFKALLRQWWRVLAAKECGYDHKRVREAEGRLFGHAWLNGNGGKSWAMKSRVLIKLNRWVQGNLHALPAEKLVFHKEVGTGGKNVGTHLYLGYGPLVYKSPNTVIKASPAIDTGDTAEMAVGFPEGLKISVLESIQLIHWFGAVGGRSRNAWGSLTLEGPGLDGFGALGPSHSLVNKISRPIESCLALDWQHAIGRDSKSVLIWKSKHHQNNWSDILRELAEAKIQFRTHLTFSGPVGRLEERHVLAYPVTNHRVNGWQKSRLANQIRFKVAKDEQGYFGIIYHLPCKLPEALCRQLAGNHGDLRTLQAKEMAIWRKVHACLDANTSFKRI